MARTTFLWNVARQNVTHFFPKKVVITPAGEERRWKNKTNVPWDVDYLEIHADYRGGTSGTTAVTLNTDGVGGVSDEIAVTLTYDEDRKVLESGLEIPAGATLYAFISGASGGHEDLQVLIEMGSC